MSVKQVLCQSNKYYCIAYGGTPVRYAIYDLSDDSIDILFADELQKCYNLGILVNMGAVDTFELKEEAAMYFEVKHLSLEDRGVKRNFICFCTKYETSDCVADFRVCEIVPYGSSYTLSNIRFQFLDSKYDTKIEYLGVNTGNGVLDFTFSELKVLQLRPSVYGLVFITNVETINGNLYTYRVALLDLTRNTQNTFSLCRVDKKLAPHSLLYRMFSYYTYTEEKPTFRVQDAVVHITASGVETEWVPVPSSIVNNFNFISPTCELSYKKEWNVSQYTKLYKSISGNVSDMLPYNSMIVELDNCIILDSETKSHTIRNRYGEVK